MGKTITITLRIDKDLAEKLASYAQALRAVSGIKITRSDVIRMLLIAGLKRGERDLTERLAVLPLDQDR